MYPFFSILIPVYNAEKTIEHCLKAIKNQNYDNYEVVIIDDGSTDNSYEILHGYAEVDSHIKVLKQDNKGVAYTRQQLVSKAIGDYILFCDADDYMEKNALHTMALAIANSGADVIICGFQIETSSGSKKILCSALQSGVYTKDVYSQYHVKNLTDLYWSALWNKCYKKNIFNQPTEIQFSKTMEDVICNVEILGRANSVYIEHSIVYHYVQIGQSLTRNDQKDSETKILEALQAYQLLEMKLKKYYPGENRNIERYIYGRYLCSMYRGGRLHNKKIQNDIKYLIKEKHLKKQIGIGGVLSEVINYKTDIAKSKLKQLLRLFR